MILHKALVAVAGALVLAGCNMIVSDEPMLVRGPDTPVMKPGVWINARSTDCAIDMTKAVETWPDCAQPAIVRADGSFLTYSKESGKWRAIDMVLGSGDPTVVQAHVPDEITANSADAPKFIYLAMRATQRDGEGRITAMETWMPICGPIDKARAASGREEDMVTRHPFPGLRIVGANCHADTIVSLEDAAARSEALGASMGDEKGAARWVKDAPAVDVE